MKFVLFLIFLTTAPNSLPKEKRVWALQSTSSMEFENIDLCQEAGQSLERNTNVTATITLRFYCFPKTDDARKAMMEKFTTARPAAAESAEEKALRAKVKADGAALFDKATTLPPQ